MKRISPVLLFVGAAVLFPSITLAASNSDIERFANGTLSTVAIIASLAAVLFLIRGGYLYITSNGKPGALFEAKRTIRNALIGLAIVLGAGVFSSLLSQAFTQPSTSSLTENIALAPIVPVVQDSSLAQILIDAMTGFLRSIIQSATKPVLDGIIGMLTSTPDLVSNSVVFNFWLAIVGITDSLFVLVIALLGFQLMSASSFGFEEVSLQQLLPRIGLSFLLANTSIFLIGWIVSLSQAMVTAVLHATGGIATAWVLTAFDPSAIFTDTTGLVTIIFMAIFLILAVVLLLFYISRLMILAVGAVLSPLTALLWVLPKFSGFAENAAKMYLVTVFSLFLHVIIIQLASSFLTLPSQVGANPFVSVLVGISLFSLLLKTTETAAQLVLASQATSSITKIGGQVMNVVSAASGKVAK
jgi:hypothetical protein